MMLNWQNPEKALSLHMQLRELAGTLPDFADPKAPLDEWQEWLGRLHAIVDAIGAIPDVVTLQNATRQIDKGFEAGERGKHIVSILFRALAKTELYAPATTKGSFIGVGAGLDAYAALSKILSDVKDNVLIVDPYMDHSIITDFAPLVPDGILIRLLTDEQSVKASFPPAVARWSEQYGEKKPLSARLATARSLHDRAIIADYRVAWSLTQSFKDFAQRSPATISKIEGDACAMKRDAYESIWEASKAL
jgi:hypothetical protein